KCLLVYITLSAFLTDKELVGIFGSNLLEDPGMAKFMHELTGMDDARPKSVKGARDQVNTAIVMGIKLRQELRKPLPMLYEDYKASYYYESYEHQNRYDNYYNHEHGLPEAFEVRLQRKLEECWNAAD
ncbi:MAG: hypothetical protein HUJ56_09945, partial [Erysipelotrichaceae bacterium]|nr:hypothetical protein [Erysipelotrichaceae bacterium]